MGKSAKFTKRISKDILAPKSNSSSKSSSKIKKKQSKRKVRAAIAKRQQDGVVNNDRDYVDIFVGKSTYKAFN
ncbi:1690_t:CDS:2 [Cetraspora pellucida]|uniref:1690_t:CDS:1 n=1 Tax=Cetraspora pellucida TaxID=1433469 RepID=A0A9N9EYB6_9GLOM|nr:1690_t:CDS:2 [Cetraspora pellucida]